MASGIIRNLNLYFKTKVMDYTGLSFPRGIKPSDMDALLDNNGQFLFIDYKSWKCSWHDLEYGQRTTYFNLMNLNPEKTRTLIIWHRPEVTGNNNGMVCLNPARDTIAFQEIAIHDGHAVVNGWYHGCLLQEYLDRFFGVVRATPDEVRDFFADNKDLL